MTASKGFLATVEPCGNRCTSLANVYDPCEGCQDNDTRLEVHPDTPVISLEALEKIFRAEADQWGTNPFTVGGSVRRCLNDIWFAIEDAT